MRVHPGELVTDGQVPQGRQAVPEQAKYHLVSKTQNCNFLVVDDENRTGGILEPTKRRDGLEEGDVSRATAEHGGRRWPMAQIGPDPSMTPPQSVSRLFELLHRTNLSSERKTDKKTNCGIVQWLLSSTYLDCAALVTSAAQETPGLRPQPPRAIIYDP